MTEEKTSTAEASPQVVIHKHESRSNGMGTAGFVLSIIALVTCGTFWPFALLFSFIGVFKKPRGLAVAGLIISSACAVFFFTVGLAIIGTLSAGIFLAGKAGELADMKAQLSPQIQNIRNFYANNQMLPGNTAGQLMLEGQVDKHGNAFVYEKTGEESYTITSAGADGEFDTWDDVQMSQALRR